MSELMIWSWSRRRREQLRRGGGVVWDDFLQEVTLELSLEADWVKRDEAFLAEQERAGTGHTCVAAAGGSAGPETGAWTRCSCIRGRTRRRL